HVADLAKVIVDAAEADVAVRKAYDVAGPVAQTFRSIVADASQAIGRRVVPLPLPARPVIRALQWIERRGRTLPIKAEQVERLVEDKAFDIGAAIHDLGFSPRSFSEGIRAEA